jgi:hypothetical protein
MGELTESIRNELRTAVASLKRQGLVHDKAPIAALRKGYAYIGLSPITLDSLLDSLDMAKAQVAVLTKQQERVQVCVANGHHELYHSPDGGFCRQCGWRESK